MSTEGLFTLGQVVSTQGAADLMLSTNITVFQLTDRHITGDWGELSLEDAAANEDALRLGHGGRILSVYEIGDNQSIVWVITEADRSVTTIMLPSEY